MRRSPKKYIHINANTDKQFKTILKAFEFSDETILVDYNDNLYVKKPNEAFHKVTDSWVEWRTGKPSKSEIEEFKSKPRKEILKWFFDHTSSELMKILTKNSQFRAFIEILPDKLPSLYWDGETICISEEVFYPIKEGGIPSKIIQKDLNLLKSVCPKKKFEIPIGPFNPYKVVILNGAWHLKYKNRYVKDLNSLKDIINHLRTPNDHKVRG